VFSAISLADIRAWKEKIPKNVATLIRKAVGKLFWATHTGIATSACQTQVLNAVLILTRLIPVVFEDPDWNGFFWTPFPMDDRMEMPVGHTQVADPRGVNFEPVLAFEITADTPLAHVLMSTLLDLMFAPMFTVERPETPRSAFVPYTPQATIPVRNVNAYRYIWHNGVGEAKAYPGNKLYHSRRAALMELLLVCLSMPLYSTPADILKTPDLWMQFFLDGVHPKALACSSLR